MIECDNLVNVDIDDDDVEKVKEIMMKVLEKENAVGAYVNVIIVDNDYIHKINKEYRNIDRPTDVISFALEDDDSIILPNNIRVLGDIYVSIDKIYEQAKSYNHSNLREFAFLCVHGLYHLLGYDHDSIEKEKIMFSKQEEILKEYGIER